MHHAPIQPRPRRALCIHFAVALLALLATVPLAAQPSLTTAVRSFDDVNGNGVLDCGEPVVLVATYATRNAGTPALTGKLLVPAAGTAGLVYQAGSLSIDDELTVGCQPRIVQGDTPGDTAGEIDFACPADPPDNDSWTVVVTYRALYSAAATAFTATAHATTSDGAVYDAAAHGTGSAACTGAGSALALQKTVTGSGAPGSTLLYTLTVHDLSGLGDGGLQLVDTVPPNTTFDLAASSPGWTCAADGNAGATCRNPVGNLAPGGTLARTFAVDLATPLPAGVAAIANTACVREGPTKVAACASVASPTAGTPVLALAKSVQSGNGTPGATLVYDLAIRNAGNQGLAAVTLQETVPAATTFAPAASAAGWACNPASGAAGAACTLALGGLAAGATLHRAFAVTVAAPLPAGVAAVANTACATAPTVATFSAISAACSTVTVATLGQPRLTLTKTYDGTPVTAGAELPFRLAYANAGNQGAAGVTLMETVPPLTSFVGDASSPGWICVPAAGGPGAACTLPLGTLAASAGGSATFVVRAPAPLPVGQGPFANSACLASGSDRACAQATTPSPVPAPTTPRAIPTLGGCGLAILVAALGGTALPRLRRRTS